VLKLFVKYHIPSNRSVVVIVDLIGYGWYTMEGGGCVRYHRVVVGFDSFLF